MNYLPLSVYLIDKLSTLHYISNCSILFMQLLKTSIKTFILLYLVKATNAECNPNITGNPEFKATLPSKKELKKRYPRKALKLLLASFCIRVNSSDKEGEIDD